MRIAVTGTHGVGKTTLIEDFVAAYPQFAPEQEPHWALAQQGVPFADGATVGDLETQLKASCEMILTAEAEDVVFDRCPLDFVAYLDVVSANEGFEWEPDGRLPARMGAAVAALDVVAFVPLRQPDEIGVAIEQPRLRAQVDRRLKAVLRRDELGLLADGPRVVEISGTPHERVMRLAGGLGLE
jgi:hypothetical protein